MTDRKDFIRPELEITDTHAADTNLIVFVATVSFDMKLEAPDGKNGPKVRVSRGSEIIILDRGKNRILVDTIHSKDGKEEHAREIGIVCDSINLNEVLTERVRTQTVITTG